MSSYPPPPSPPHSTSHLGASSSSMSTQPSNSSLEDEQPSRVYSALPLTSPNHSPVASTVALPAPSSSPRGRGAGETAPMLGTYSDHPNLDPYTDPLAPPPGLRDYNNRASVQSSMGSLGSSPSFGDVNRLTRTFSDDDSQRVLYPAGAGDGPGRRGSNLNYGSNQSDLDRYDNEDDQVNHDKEREHRAVAGAGLYGSPTKSKGWWSNLSRGARWAIVGLLLVLVAVGVGVGVKQATAGKNNSVVSADGSSSAASSAGNGNAGSATKSAANPKSTAIDPKSLAVGYSGSTVYTETGKSFVYNNTFGGFWNAIPFNDSAQAQSDTPPLNQPWDYNVNTINGVNLGGWLMLEPFITPALFEPFNPNPISTNPTVIDEWTLCIALGSNMSAVIEEHYNTFITEEDFAEIAAAGLNWIRLPIPYWIIEVYQGEPFLANVGWTYFLKALTWARKYGLRVNLDYHATPGSVNGYNHGSKYGSINWLHGTMGIANAQRSLNYIRTLTEFVSQPQYKNVVPMFSVLNEPISTTIGIDLIRQFYYEAYTTVRGITGLGQGKGPFIGFHDGFSNMGASIAEGGWGGYLPGMDRVALDYHPYLCFGEPNADSLAFQATKPCSSWAHNMNITTADFGVAIAGEWSLAINDCGKWINNVGVGNRHDGSYIAPGASSPAYAGVGSCKEWNDWENYSAATKAGLQTVFEAHASALRNWFFWTWKTGYSTSLGKIANPLWNYQLALQEGYAPTVPRMGGGFCQSILRGQGVAAGPSQAVAPLSAWMTGGAGAGTILNRAQVTEYGVWPPTALGNTPAQFLPTYTPTGRIVTLPVSTPTSYPAGYSSVTPPGNGWFQAQDTAGYFTPVQGCDYPNPWSGLAAPVPTAACTGAGGARMAARVPTTPTPAPTPSKKPSKRWD